MTWMNGRSRLLKIALPVVSLLIGTPGWSSPLPVDSHSASDLNPAANELTLDRRQGIGIWGLRTDDREQGVEDKEQAIKVPPFASSPIAQATESRPEATQEESDRSSPVLEKWEQKIPNVLENIKRDPSFRTRARLGLSYFPSTFDSLGWNVGVEDIFLDRLGATGLTLSGDYQATFTGKRKAGGADLRYYLLPLGGYFNLAPVLGYRYLETPRYITDGLNVGFRVQAVLSRTGAADISLTQTWVAPQQSDEVGVTKLSFGVALIHNLRVSTDVEKQNSKQKKDTRYGISMEWML
ncbi:hypothetical protein [Leptodesmis sp.]|uniref:hypothetical protein n=1 Tax=Leptodesmis sp. TaxID=3100501 RepID=UPI0040534D74